MLIFIFDFWLRFFSCTRTHIFRWSCAKQKRCLTPSRVPSTPDRFIASRRNPGVRATHRARPDPARRDERFHFCLPRGRAAGENACAGNFFARASAPNYFFRLRTFFDAENFRSAGSLFRNERAVQFATARFRPGEDHARDFCEKERVRRARLAWHIGCWIEGNVVPPSSK